MNPADTFGDRVEFDAVNLGGGKTRIYLGDSSDDILVARGLAHERRGVDRRLAERQLLERRLDGALELDQRHQRVPRLRLLPERPVRLRRLRRQPCRPAGRWAGHADELWLGGSMNYDELVAYGGLPPRSNGRAVIRSTNGGAAAPDVTWQDMTATLDSGGRINGGIHPDEHAVAFDPANPAIAFVGSDGGVVRVDVRNPRNASSACSTRTFGYNNGHGAVPLARRRPGRLPAGPERDPDGDQPLNDGLQHDPVPVAVVQPGESDRRAARRHAGQRHLLVHAARATWFEIDRR